MTKDSYKLWVDYHNGIIKRSLTKEEQQEIDASDFAMHLLIPSDSIKKICNKFGGYQNVLNNHFLIDKISLLFIVPRETIIFKIQYLMQKEKKETLKKSNQKVIKIY